MTLWPRSMKMRLSILSAGTAAIRSCLLARKRQDLRAPLRGGAVLRPIRHQPPALLEQVAAPVGRLRLVADGVGERHLADLSGIGGALGRPVPEGRAKPMYGEVVAAHSAQELEHRHIAQGGPLLAPCEQEGALGLRLDDL